MNRQSADRFMCHHDAPAWPSKRRGRTIPSVGNVVGEHVEAWGAPLDVAQQRLPKAGVPFGVRGFFGGYSSRDHVASI